MRFIIAILCVGCGTIDVSYNPEENDIDQGSNISVTALKAIDGNGDEIGELITVDDGGLLAKILHQGILIDVNLVTGFISSKGLSEEEYHANSECSSKLNVASSAVPEELCGAFSLRRVVGIGWSIHGWTEAADLWVYGEKASWGEAWEYFSENQGCFPHGSQCWVELVPFTTKGFETPITLQ